jgi:DNA-binding GntR family transcriptional regulator
MSWRERVEMASLEWPAARIVRPSVVRLRRGPSLAQRAHRYLKLQFMLGEMAPGCRLTYRGIALRLGISVTPAREAICQLIGERVLDLRPGGVAVVPELDPSRCRELWEIRLLHEGACAEAAAGVAGPELLRSLERSHARMAAAKQARRLREAMRHNLAFHMTLYRAARMPVLFGLIEDVWARSAGYVRAFHQHHVEGRIAGAAQGPHVHTTLVAALRAGDPLRARGAIERDLLEVRDGYLGLAAHVAAPTTPAIADRPLAAERRRGGTR